MSQIRICPACKFSNPPSEDLCARCKCLISGVPLTEEINQDAPNVEPDKITLVTEGGSVFANPPSEDLCAKCECIISGVTLTEDVSNIINAKNTRKSEPEIINKSINQDAPNVEPDKITLVTEGGSVIYAAHSDIIGRRGVGGDALQNQAVSGQHAILLQCDNKWFIIDNHSTNGTFINGERIESDKEYEIKPGDIISLSALVNLFVQ